MTNGTESNHFVINADKSRRYPHTLIMRFLQCWCLHRCGCGRLIQSGDEDFAVADVAGAGIIHNGQPLFRRHHRSNRSIFTLGVNPHTHCRGKVPYTPSVCRSPGLQMVIPTILRSFRASFTSSSLNGFDGFDFSLLVITEFLRFHRSIPVPAWMHHTRRLYASR